MVNMGSTQATKLPAPEVTSMNPDRFAKERDYPSGDVGYGMSRNVYSRVFKIHQDLNRIQTSIDQLQIFREQFADEDLSSDSATGAMTSIKALMRSLDAIEYAFPDLGDKVWFGGFKDDVHGAYWRVEAGRFDGVFDMESGSLESLSFHVNNILGNVSDSSHTNPINQLHRFLERYGDEFDPYHAPEEYYKEVFEARDLFCLGYFSTGLIVLGRAVERVLLHVGHARHIRSVDGFGGSTQWESARFFERTEALYNIDMPDDSGKMISKRQYHQIQLLIDHRNKVAHDEYRTISKSEAARTMGQTLELLSKLEATKIKLEDIPVDQIQERTDVSIM